MCLEGATTVAEESGLPGRQGRLLCAYLVVERFRPVIRDELLDVLWPALSPSAPDSGLNALVSRVRRWFASVPGGPTVVGGDSGYQLAAQPRLWIDVECARLAADEADAALRAADHRSAWAKAVVTAAITRRPFLPGADGPWPAATRTDLGRLLCRSLDVLAASCTATGQSALAITAASELVAREPYGEAGYRRLIAAHQAAGDRAAALRVYQRCRGLLADELGVEPSAETQAAFLDALRAGTGRGHHG